MKPFSQASENNRHFIEDVLRRVFSKTTRVLEIGSGTGQHAVHFSSALPHLDWQASDLAENHEGINQWVQECGGDNLYAPVTLDVTQSPWPVSSVDGIYTANTAHIMPWHAVVALFSNLKTVLETGGVMVMYGPFNYGGEFTSESNRNFEQWLKARAAHQGIRDIEKVIAEAKKAGLSLVEDNEMPANNRLLVFKKL